MYLQCDHARGICCIDFVIRDIRNLFAIDPGLNARANGQHTQLVPLTVDHGFIAGQVFLGCDPGTIALVKDMSAASRRFSNIDLRSMDRFPRLAVRVFPSQHGADLNAGVQVGVVKFDFQFKFEITIRFDRV